MPTIKSAKKRVKTSERNRQRNLALRSAMRSAIREVKDLVSAGKIEEAIKRLPEAFSRIDKAVKADVAHRNAAARYKSNLSNRIVAANKI